MMLKEHEDAPSTLGNYHLPGRIQKDPAHYFLPSPLNEINTGDEKYKDPIRGQYIDRHNKAT